MVQELFLGEQCGPRAFFCQYVDVHVTTKFRFPCIFWEFRPFEPRPDNVMFEQL